MKDKDGKLLQVNKIKALQRFIVMETGVKGKQ